MLNDIRLLIKKMMKMSLSVMLLTQSQGQLETPHIFRNFLDIVGSFTFFKVQVQVIYIQIRFFQSAITCLKLTIETLEQVVKYGVVLLPLLLTLNIFFTFF